MTSPSIKHGPPRRSACPRTNGISTWPSPPLLRSHHPRLTPVGGGVPIFHEGRLVGGIGVSGGTSAQDHEAAEEALRHAGFNQ
ncbi:GlcG/HbpS family heme-binding protein [Trinickia symbiotica]|uniref:GlcG/HbpS family heme-binding protein n=1 Tax=Trinickia symbiotica TaxID=863227 RepID=UPI002D21D711|nr:heme-binding protein [Trinickia symbiotica]